MICPHCNQEIEISREEITRQFSKIASEKKQENSRQNGKKGGRPKKDKQEANE